jgi:hypothetical protein
MGRIQPMAQLYDFDFLIGLAGKVKDKKYEDQNKDYGFRF